MKGSPVLVPDAVSQVYITNQLAGRVADRIDLAREKLAVQDIARQMANNPSQVLPTLVDLAIDLCGAVAGGISIYEKDGHVFRWHHLRGTLERFTGATTPRDYSPCGITLDHKSPVLVQKPERVYSWLVDADVSLPECLLVPLYVGEEEPLGTLWIVSQDVGHFTDGHASTMQELAGFTGIALQMIRSEDRLKTALEEQELLTREMGHRVKNLFAIADGMIRLSAKSSDSKDQMAQALSGRLHALAGANALVRRTFSPSGQSFNASNLSEIIATVLKPYSHATTTLRGPPVQVGEHATNTIALVFHEMATNAAKYGALSTEAGTVTVEWEIEDGRLELVWNEAGGPPIPVEPDSSGFGSSLVTNTITRHGGTIASTWHRNGVEVRIALPVANLAH
jgi:two-component sensor histidine kinase